MLAPIISSLALSGLINLSYRTKIISQPKAGVASIHMQTRQDIINFCMTLPGAYEDYPFANITDIGVWTVMRHRGGKKTFAMIFERGGKLCVNLKCDPFEADFLRQTYNDVTPGYHMNKTHWNTVVPGGDLPDEELMRMIRHSWNLTLPKTRILKQ